MNQFFLGVGTGLGIVFIILTVISMVHLYKFTKRYRVDQEDLQAMISHQDRELDAVRKELNEEIGSLYRTINSEKESILSAIEKNSSKKG